MKETRVAIRYAKALFELCLNESLMEQVGGDMRMLSNLFTESREFRRFLGSPVIPNKKKKAVLNSMFGEQVSGLTMNFIRLMVDNNREQVIGAVATEFHTLYKHMKGIVSAELTTATLLEPSLRDEIIRIIEQETHSTVELREKTDPSILGGFKLQVEDKQFDASIIHKIQKLSREFDKNTYEKGF